MSAELIELRSKCGNCGHEEILMRLMDELGELRDDNAGMCPFCGGELIYIYDYDNHESN